MNLAIKLFVKSQSAYALGPGKVELLRLVQELGSLLKAAQKMGISYRWAWGRIKKTQADLGVPLLARCDKGVAGRANSLTPEAKEILHWYRKCEEKLNAVLAEVQSGMPDVLKGNHGGGPVVRKRLEPGD